MFDAASSVQGSPQVLTWSHTVGTDANRLLLVGLSIERDDASGQSVSYAGQPLTRIGQTSAPGGEPLVEIWQLKNPPSGPADIVATLDRDGRDVVGGAASFSNVDQSTPTGTVVSNSGSDNAPTVTISSAVNEMVLDVVAADKDANSLSVGSGQTERWNRNPGDVYGGGSTEPGAASVTMSWSLGSGDPWGILAVAIKPPSTAADLTVVKSVAVYDSATMGLRALPGEDVIYTIRVSNAGDAVNADTVFVIDAIPADMTFYNDDMDDGGPATGPVYFIDGGSGLTCCLAADIEYSSSTVPPPVFGYIPVVGYDPNVHFIRINPKGTMNPGGSPDPTFSLQFRARIN